MTRSVDSRIDANEPLKDAVDIALYDSFAQPESDHGEIELLVRNPRAHRVVVYTWNFHPSLIESARSKGAHGYLSKTLPARELVDALEAGPDHPRQEQRRDRPADLPQPQHRQVLHPHHLPQDRRRQPHQSGAVGNRSRLHSRPSPDRPLAARAVAP
jgi:hypothetical protein